jgi:hypothetical protein
MVAPSTQQAWLVSVSGIPGYWQTKSGGEKSSETTKDYDGGSLEPEVIASPAEIDNITVSRSYKPSRDLEALRMASSKVGRWRTTVSITPTDEDMMANGQPRTYPNALLVRCTEPEVDRSSGDPATWELEFAVAVVV